MNLSNKPHLDRVRDLFLVGCYTGLRFSDFSRLTPKNIADGFIEIKQSKTGGNVVIPVHSVIKRIIIKYSGLPPTISNQKFNTFLKDVCKTVPSLQNVESKTTTKAGKKITISEEMGNGKQPYGKAIVCYQRILERNIYPHHNGSDRSRTEKAFLKYIKVSRKEEAERMKQHWESRESKLMAV